MTLPKVGDFYSGGSTGKFFFCPIQLKFQFEILTRNKNVIAKNSLGNYVIQAFLWPIWFCISVSVTQTCWLLLAITIHIWYNWVWMQSNKQIGINMLFTVVILKHCRFYAHCAILPQFRKFSPLERTRPLSPNLQKNGCNMKCTVVCHTLFGDNFFITSFF